MGFTCATAAAAGLHAPHVVWIATLILAAICLVTAGVQHWREGRHSAGGEASAAASVEPLTKALSEALSLRDRAASYPNEKPPFQEDPLWRWTQRTYELICEHHPAYADDFYGPDATIDPGDLFIAFCYETQNHGRNHYLDQRIALLKAIMAEASVTRPGGRP